MDELKLRKIAAFFYKHRNFGAWWISPILVQHPEAQQFGLSQAEAESVFSAFVEKGFLREDQMNTQTVGGVSFPAYRFNLTYLKELREFSELKWYHKLPAPLSRLAEKVSTVMVVCVILVLTSFFQSFFEKMGESLYESLFGK